MLGESQWTPRVNPKAMASTRESIEANGIGTPEEIWEAITQSCSGFPTITGPSSQWRRAQAMWLPGIWFQASCRVGLASNRKPPQSLSTPLRTQGIRRTGRGNYRPVRYPHHDLGKTFVVSMDQPVHANGDGSLTYEGERWIAVEPLRFRNVADARELTFQEDANGQIRHSLHESRERANWWYQSGRAAIACYFCFLVISALILSGTRNHGKRRDSMDGRHHPHPQCFLA